MKWISAAALALLGAAGLFFGLALLLRWANMSPWVGVLTLTGGVLALAGAGASLRPDWPKALSVPGIGSLAAAAVTAVEMPDMLGADEALHLWILMGSGLYLFFGLCLLIGAGYSLLTSSKA